MPVSIDRKRWDLFIVLTAPPHTIDTLTTVLRLAQAMIDAGRTVRIWACGYNTMLTQVSLDENKKTYLADPERVFPSASGTIRRMLAENEGRLGWIVCTACSAERGATQQIPEVRMRSEMRLAHTIAAADRTIYIGGA